jgi:hypothetical protein
MSRAADTTPPDRSPRLLDEEQEQLAQEIMMSIDLAVESGRISLTAAEGALAMAHMRLDAIIGEAMESQVDEELGGGDDDDEDPNAFLRRPREDGDANG